MAAHSRRTRVGRVRQHPHDSAGGGRARPDMVDRHFCDRVRYSARDAGIQSARVRQPSQTLVIVCPPGAPTSAIRLSQMKKVLSQAKGGGSPGAGGVLSEVEGTGN